jgi:monovalent cation:H+ antiporter-2, CPA2 family
MARAVAFFAVVVAVAVRARPLLDRLFGVGSDDLFVLLTGGVVLLLGWAALRAGLSEAIGAFLAGLVVAETRHRERADRLFAPLQGVFAAVFFFAFGLSIDPRTFGAVWIPATLLALLAVIVKVGGGWLAGRRSGLSPRGSLSLGLMLVPRGEFSIILAGLALTAGLDRLAALLALLVLILSLVGTATLQYAPRIARWIFPPPRRPGLEDQGFRPDLAGFSREP